MNESDLLDMISDYFEKPPSDADMPSEPPPPSKDEHKPEEPVDHSESTPNLQPDEPVEGTGDATSSEEPVEPPGAPAPDDTTLEPPVAQHTPEEASEPGADATQPEERVSPPEFTPPQEYELAVPDVRVPDEPPLRSFQDPHSPEQPEPWAQGPSPDEGQIEPLQLQPMPDWELPDVQMKPHQGEDRTKDYIDSRMMQMGFKDRL